MEGRPERTSGELLLFSVRIVDECDKLGFSDLAGPAPLGIRRLLRAAAGPCSVEFRQYVRMMAPRNVPVSVSQMVRQDPSMRRLWEQARLRRDEAMYVNWVSDGRCVRGLVGLVAPVAAGHGLATIRQLLCRSPDPFGPSDVQAEAATTHIAVCSAEGRVQHSSFTGAPNGLSRWLGEVVPLGIEAGHVQGLPSWRGCRLAGLDPLTGPAGEAWLAHVRPVVGLRDPGGQITSRQLEIARLATAGFTAREIAAQLQVREMTVRTHLRNTYERLGVANRLELEHMLRA